KRQSSTREAISEKREKFVPDPSYVAPSGYGFPGQTFTADFGRAKGMPSAVFDPALFSLCEHNYETSILGRPAMQLSRRSGQRIQLDRRAARARGLPLQSCRFRFRGDRRRRLASAFARVETSRSAVGLESFHR